ncbi:MULTISPECIES: ABC transporter ATP-binding protein [Bacillota]|uniref:ABC transporter ATP-binding protein n=2 Tax=root TaxID=1 RepID=A0ABS8D1K8_9FIRM|nr:MULTISPECIES: ABC transporter ATP-binding protein [Bacillota]MBS6686477.1 ABC transporter ATP-binding protein [Thomasclavelia spiroformis]MCB5398550.1 ABC transporter ATP-binding protein [Intestinibacter bartlettii]MCB5404972.1 ABC transporter ATP-binding protein [Intestinibacter bartlettii]MCB5447377.1 ABC transporter ATP-binding protein [Intestinibacter bartlettii]MCB5720216.1 ABC transporter ATP-binding protein [Intestinibacter bartlettii]
MVIISLKDVNKKYDSNFILKNVNLDIEDSKIYVIKGESGVGKSTLLNILGLLDKPTSGNIEINGKIVNNLKDDELSEIRMNTLGFVFQSFYLNNNLKAYENVEVAMYINKKFSKKEIENRAENLLEILGLSDKKMSFPNELSGGEQQRVAIARALANEAKCILADEPTGNLDKNNEKIVLDCFKNLANDGRTIVIVTHSDSVLEYADKVYCIKNGILEEL